MPCRPSLVDPVSYQSVRPHPPASKLALPRLAIGHFSITPSRARCLCRIAVKPGQLPVGSFPAAPKSATIAHCCSWLPSRGDHASLVLSSLLLPLSLTSRSYSGEEQQ